MRQTIGMSLERVDNQLPAGKRSVREGECGVDPCITPERRIFLWR